jgi:hypothetical protein
MATSDSISVPLAQWERHALIDSPLLCCSLWTAFWQWAHTIAGLTSSPSLGVKVLCYLICLTLKPIFHILGTNFLSFAVAWHLPWQFVLVEMSSGRRHFSQLKKMSLCLHFLIKVCPLEFVNHTESSTRHYIFRQFSRKADANVSASAHRPSLLLFQPTPYKLHSWCHW